jgi:hypothetical protein
MIRKVVKNLPRKIRISSPIMKSLKLARIIISCVLIFYSIPAQVVQPYDTFEVFMSDSSLDLEQLLATGFVIDSNTIVGCYHIYRDSNKPKIRGAYRLKRNIMMNMSAMQSGVIRERIFL